MSFAANNQVVLDEQKIFLNKVIDRTPFVNNLVFQGSNDAITFTDITTFGNEIHEGCNYVSYRDLPNKPSYNIYRYWGKVAGSCRVGEFRLPSQCSLSSFLLTYQFTETRSSVCASVNLRCMGFHDLSPWQEWAIQQMLVTLRSSWARLLTGKLESKSWLQQQASQTKNLRPE